MIADEVMARRDAGVLIDHAVAEMIAEETLRRRAAEVVGESFPVLTRGGTGRVVRTGEQTISLLVSGVRTECTWVRVCACWQRLVENHTLTVDELGGRDDAVALVSLLAHLQRDLLDVDGDEGLLVLKDVRGTPVHQYTPLKRRGVWSR